MHYYSFNISDFNNSTRHLTRLERSIYRDLIDMYYDTEQPISRDIKLVSRKIIANSPEEIEVIEQILEEFFTATGGGYTKHRIDKEIAIYHSKADTARANGKLGGRPKKPQETQDKPSGLIIGTESKPIANPEESGLKANQELITNNHKLVTNKIPYQLIADAYNDFASKTGNPEVIKLTSPRKLAVKKLWNFDLDNEDVNRQTNNADYWVRYFNHCLTISFLNNSVEKTGDHANWRPDFDFMVKEKTYIGVREGKYT